jgi:hypothetical protein
MVFLAPEALRLETRKNHGEDRIINICCIDRVFPVEFLLYSDKRKKGSVCRARRIQKITTADIFEIETTET